MLKNRFVLTGLMAAFFLLLNIKPASAVIVSPVIIDHDMAPGTSVEGKMLITNDTGSSQSYYTSVQSFLPEGEEGEQKFLPETDISGLPSWFSLSDKKISVDNTATKEVKYKITVPQNAEPGGHYAAVFFSLNPNDVDKSGVGIGAKTGILFLVKVAGDIKEDAKIESFTVNQPVFSHLPAMMSLRIRNLGSVHFRPTGTLTVRNMWGGIVARVPANPKNSAVLPNSIRRLDTWWAKDINVIEGSGFMIGLQNEWKNFALGRYTATVDAKYGSKNTPLEGRTVSFWVIPWRMLLILLALLALLFLGMKLYNKTIVSSAMKKQGTKK